MSETEVEIIKGGWSQVPKHLFCKTDLKQKGLRPGSKPEAKVWNSYNWINLYDINKARPPRPLTHKQKENLRKGRARLKELLTCSKCNESMDFKRDMVDDICKYCHWKEVDKAEQAWREEQWRIEQEEREQEIRDMIDSGTSKFREWYEKDYVILDTETTGLYGAEIVEISIVSKDGKVLFDSLIKPTIDIPQEAIHIHGISNESVKDAPTWADVWPQIEEIITSNLVLIFNDQFDRGVINNSCRAHGIEPPRENMESDCVMQTYADFVGSERWISLTNALGELTEHRALEDCKSVLKLLDRVYKEIQTPV